MRDLLGVPPGERLGLDAYREDFRGRDFAVAGCDSWKLERRQHFREPGDASWNAFARGDWEGALRLIEAQRAELRALSRLAARHRCRLLRIRVVEQRLTPYLQWELHLLRVRAQCGELIRVISPQHIAAYERDGAVPELVTLNDDTVYEILYDEEGVLEGAVRYLGARTRDRIVARVEELYVLGEDIGTFFDREVAHLMPPTGV
ncbi:DUF6879 family protein [Streptomyces sp. NPDC056061]|uniref:DUF6879 family protein n=1 Tax=Streptomyces sp. NPDC056061 TaxID=3345700 RepID=UPI0035DC3C2B